ncbi:hypothetical protein JCM11251_001930 [Rhodosporidiobolus azoricus]
MGLVQRLEVESKEGASKSLDNEDLRPTPRERRTWGLMMYNLFWFTAVGNVTNMSSGSAWLAKGVSYWEGLGCSVAGYFIISFVMVFNGRPGSKWHIGFPVACRSSFGVYGALWPAVNRAAMACLWQGVNATSGAQSLYLCFYAMFPSIKNVHNTMDSRSALNSAQMIMFFVFQACVAFMCFLSVPKWRVFVWAKVAAFVLSSAGMLAWGITAAGGVGDIVHHTSTVHGSEKSWLLVQMILTSAASCSTFASNAADFQRQATKPSDPIVGQIIGFPISNFITQVVGMLTTSTSSVVYGEIVWNPTVYLTQLLEDNYDAKHRAAAFFIGVMWTYSLMFSCVFENVLPAGNDIASLCPRFISIKRGFFICIAISMIINPWYLLGSASIIITVISSYQIFLFSIIGIMLVDYYVISKGFFDIPQLFTPAKEGKYYYTYGFNPRAFAAYFVGVAINFAGFLTNFGIIDSVKLTRSYWFSIFTTTFGASATYYLLNIAFPQQNKLAVWSEPKGVWEPTDEQLGITGRVESATEEDKDSTSFEKGDETSAEVRAAQLPELRV